MDVEYRFLARQQVFFFLSLHVQVCLGKKSFAQIEIFLDAMPLRFVQSAFTEQVDAGAFGDSHVRDDEARVMRRQSIVNGGGEDSKSVVEEVEE